MSNPQYPSGPGYPQQQGYPQQGYPQQQGYPPPGYPPPQPKSNLPVILGVALGVLALALVALFLFVRGGSDDAYPESTPAPTAAAPAAPAPSGATPPPPGAAAAPAAASSSRRYANSPGDGFLALRSDPSVSSGSRLVQIPHGAPVDIGGCDGPSATIGGRSGRWCRASYDGRSGYVFDAFLASSQPGPRSAPAARSGGGSVAAGPTEEAETYYQVVGAALNFRSGPSINASRVGTLSRGDTFTTSRCEVSERYEKGKSRLWCSAVSDGGLRGWVSVSNNLISALAG